MIFDKSKLPEGVRLWLAEIDRQQEQENLRQIELQKVWEEQQRIYEARIAHQLRERKSIQYFMEESDAFRFDPAGKIPIQVLYDLYRQWCLEQFITPKALRTFSGYLKKNAADYHILPTNLRWQGKHIRGFRGMRPL